MRYLILSVFCSIVYFSCISNNPRVHKGKEITIEFSRLNQVPDSAWIKIDNVTFLHTPHDFEWSTGTFLPTDVDNEYLAYIPSSIVFYYHPMNTEKRVREPISSLSIAMNLSKKITSFDKSGVTYKVKHPSALLAAGKLTLYREDGKAIRVETSIDNQAIVLSQS